MPAHAAHAHLTAQRALRLYLIVFLLLAATGWGLEYAGRAGVKGIPVAYSAIFHPTNSYADDASLGDLTDLETRTEILTGPGLRQTGATPFPYPPAAAYIFQFFLQDFEDSARAYYIAFALCGAIAVGCVAFSIRRGPPIAWAALAATVLLGAPHLFCANRGNLELFASFLASAGLALFVCGYGWMAAAALGLAMCVKPFPALLLLLFLWRKQWGRAALAVAICLTVSITALYFLGPSIPIAWQSVRACWGDYFTQQVVTLNILQELKTDHSLMDCAKLILWRIPLHCAGQGMQFTTATDAPLWARLDLYARAFEVVALAAVAWAWFHFRRMPALNQVFALVLLMLLLPFISAEYALMLLYLPAAVLLHQISSNGWHGKPRALALMAALLAALFAPLNLLGPNAGAAQTLLLLGALVVSAVVRFQQHPLDGPCPSRGSV